MNYRWVVFYRYYNFFRNRNDKVLEKHIMISFIWINSEINNEIRQLKKCKMEMNEI